MDFVLVRHRVRDPKQKDGRLTPHGMHQATALADGLKLRSTTPDLILTSKRAHALGTAKTFQQKLRPQLAPAAQLIEIDALTPKPDPETSPRYPDRPDLPARTSRCPGVSSWSGTKAG